MDLLKKLLPGMTRLRDRKSLSQPRIGLDETQVTVDGVSIDWDDINQVRAYKLDLLTTDEIRLLVGFGSPEKLLELSEEQQGFELFIEAAQVRLSFPGGWWEQLATPAFERCETTLFCRKPR